MSDRGPLKTVNRYIYTLQLNYLSGYPRVSFSNIVDNMGGTASTTDSSRQSRVELAISTTQILLDGIAGRIIDLPNGDEFRVSADTGKTPDTLVYVRTPTNHLKTLQFIGRAYAIASNRKFHIYLSKNMSVLGYEQGSGLHFLAKSLQEFLTVYGLSKRDFKVMDRQLYGASMGPLIFPKPTNNDLIEVGIYTNQQPTLRGSGHTDLPLSGEQQPLLHEKQSLSTRLGRRYQSKSRSITLESNDDAHEGMIPSDIKSRSRSISGYPHAQGDDSIKSVLF